MLVVCGVAIWVGPTYSRLAATALAIAWLATMFMAGLHSPYEVQWASFAIDVLLTAFSLWLALRWRNRAMAAFAALTCIQALTHLVMALDERVVSRAYLTMTGFASYGLLLVLVWVSAAAILKRWPSCPSARVIAAQVGAVALTTVALLAPIAVPQPVCSSGSYVSSDGTRQCSPQAIPPADARVIGVAGARESAERREAATALCSDGTYSYSRSRTGACSGHGGVMRWSAGR